MQKMMKGVKSVRCLQGAGVTIGKWVVGIPHEQPIGDGASRYSAECIWRVSTYTTHAGYTHTLTGTWDTQIHIHKTVHMCRKFAMLHQDSKCTQTQCNWVKSTYIDAHTHTNTLINTQIHIQTLQRHTAHTSDNINILIIFATGTFSGRSFIDFESILHKVMPPMLVQRECQKSYCWTLTSFPVVLFHISLFGICHGTIDKSSKNSTGVPVEMPHGTLQGVRVTKEGPL